MKKHVVQKIILLLFVFVIGASCTKKSKTVFICDKSLHIIMAEVAENGTHWYALCETPTAVGATKRFIIIDGIIGPEFDMILTPPVFSHDGKLAYAASSSGKWYINIDGSMETPYDEVSTPVFTHNGNHYAYMARKGRKSCIVVDDLPGEEYDYISWPVYSSNDTLAYVKKNFPNYKVVIGDKESDEFSDADLPIFDSSGEKYAYPVAQNDQWAIVENGTLHEWWDAVGAPIHTVNSVAYPARKYTKWFWYMQGKRGPGFDYVYGGSTSQDGTRIAYCAQENFKRFTVIDGIRGENFDDVKQVVFSSSGLFAYQAEKEGKECIVTTSGHGPSFDAVGTPLFGGKKETLVYAAKEAGMWNIYRDHRPVFKTPYHFIGKITYSSEKKKFYAIAQLDTTVLQLSWK